MEPAFEPGLFSELETPQVFEHGGRWYCLFCVRREAWSDAAEARFGQTPCQGNHWLVADDPAGPWTLGEGPLLDADHPCHRYAIRMLQRDGGEMCVIGFVDSLDEACETGTLTDPVPIHVDERGRLTLDEARFH